MVWAMCQCSLLSEWDLVSDKTHHVEQRAGAAGEVVHARVGQLHVFHPHAPAQPKAHDWENEGHGEVGAG